MEEDALEVVGGCVESDDSCVEGWYLGGWGLWVLGEKRRGVEADDADAATTEQKPKKDIDAKEDRMDCWRGSLQWLRTCLKLYEQLEYEDDRLRDHAWELVARIEDEFTKRGIDLDEADEDWESEESDREDGEGVDHDGDETMG